MFQKKVLKTIKTRILFSVTSLSLALPPPPKKKKNCGVYETAWKKHGRAGHVIDGSMAHVHCVLAS